MKNFSGRYGWLFCLGFALLTALNTVYLSHVTKTIPPEVVAAGGFIVATFLFLAISYFTKANVSISAHIARAGKLNLLVLNMATAMAWLGLFFALIYVRPSIASMMLNGVTPLFSILAVVLFTGKKVTANEWGSAAGLWIILGYIALLSMGDVSLSLRSAHFVYGALFACLAGIGQVIVVFYSRRILDRGVAPHEILQLRFFAVIFICCIMIILKKTDLSVVIENIWVFCIVGVLFVALPLYLLQWGIKGTDSVTVNIIVACIPLIVVFLELIKKDTVFHPQLFFAVLLGVGFLIYGVYAKILPAKPNPPKNSISVEEKNHE